MTDRLDLLLSSLAEASPDRDLSALEPRVWQRIAAAERTLPLAGWRLPAVSALGAMLVGIASTSVATARPVDHSPFSSAVALAPSTLLEASL